MRVHVEGGGSLLIMVPDLASLAKATPLDPQHQNVLW